MHLLPQHNKGNNTFSASRGPDSGRQVLHEGFHGDHSVVGPEGLHVEVRVKRNLNLEQAKTGVNLTKLGLT